MLFVQYQRSFWPTGILTMQVFSLEGQPFISLNNLLKVEGLCESGAFAKQVIAAGLVKVDGEIELRKRCKISSGRLIEYEGQSIKVE